jgi:hypothetical protein
MGLINAYNNGVLRVEMLYVEIFNQLPDIYLYYKEDLKFDTTFLTREKCIEKFGEVEIRISDQDKIFSTSKAENESFDWDEASGSFRKKDCPDVLIINHDKQWIMTIDDSVIRVLSYKFDYKKLVQDVLTWLPQQEKQSKTASIDLVAYDNHYYTINSKMAKTVPLPDLSDVSFRQGKAVLESLGFVVGEIIYEFSEYDGLIRSVLYDEKEVAFGTPLADGANLILVVGKSYLESASTPNLLHLTRQQAEMLLTSSGFVLGAVFYDGTQPLSEEEDRLYKVYKQSPEANVDLSQGTRIDIWLTMDAAKMYEESEPELEEEFF